MQVNLINNIYLVVHIKSGGTPEILSFDCEKKAIERAKNIFIKGNKNDDTVDIFRLTKINKKCKILISNEEMIEWEDSKN